MRIIFLLTQDLESPSGLGRYWPLAKELARLGVVVKRARPFLEINGCRQAKLDELKIYA